MKIPAMVRKGRNPGIATSGKCSRAFTLVELLIVISIIGILVALLFPVSSMVRVRIDNGACVNQLRLLAGSAIQFTHDNNGKMPSADWCKTGNRTSDQGESYSVKGSLIPYLQYWKKAGSASPTEVARCPADNRCHNGLSAWQTYCLNTYAKGVQEATSAGNPVLPETTFYGGVLFQIPSPSGMAMFMDGVKPNVSSNGAAAYPTTINFSTFTAKSDTLYVHQERINVVFMDGHGESFSQATMRARAKVKDVFWSGGMDVQ